jgi:hypothetical protein
MTDSLYISSRLSLREHQSRSGDGAGEKNSQLFLEIKSLLSIQQPGSNCKLNSFRIETEVGRGIVNRGS